VRQFTAEGLERGEQESLMKSLKDVFTLALLNHTRSALALAPLRDFFDHVQPVLAFGEHVRLSILASLELKSWFHARTGIVYLDARVFLILFLVNSQ